MALTERQVQILNELGKYEPGLREGYLSSVDQILLGDLIQAAQGGTTALALVESELLDLAAEETELTALVAVDAELISLAAVDTELLALAAEETELSVLATSESRMGVVLSGAATVDISFTAALDGEPAFACLNEANAAVHVLHAVWQGAGVLRVTLSATTSDDRDVAAIVIPALP